ncbi:MAG: hypothetical protein WAV21_00150 [Minisyncoccia bacterium]
MSWSSQRKAFILTSIGAVIFAVFAVTLISVLYKTPSCTDQKKNQDETGIDCGGSCSRLCTAEVAAPSIRFVRQLSPQNGRTDIIAYIDNTNAHAAVKNAAFKVTLYGADNIVVTSKTGTVNLPPASTVPLFIPNLFSGSQPVVRAFLTFDESSFVWYRLNEELPTLAVSDARLSLGETPRLSAIVSNSEVLPMRGVPVVATLFDAQNNVIAASGTVVDLPASAAVPVVFTWNAPFSGIPARYEIIPLVQLP